MKKKIFSLLTLVMTVMTASADAPAFQITVGANEHGTFAFQVNGTATADINGVIGADENDVITLTITPEEGWGVNTPIGEWSAAIAASRGQRRVESIDMEQYFDLDFVSEDETTGVRTYTFTMIRANAEISCSYKKLLTHADITIEDIADLTYTGQALTPTVTVKEGQTLLVLGTDYTVSYSNNVNAALSTDATAPTVTITAVASSEKYGGKATKTFTINKKALTVTAEDKVVVFGEEAPTYTVTYDGFVEGEDESVLGGTLSFDCEYVKDVTGIGEYTITPSGLTSDNYAISYANGKLTVGKLSCEELFIEYIDDQTYNGKEQKPELNITYHDMKLVLNRDYTVRFENNINAGLADVYITFIGNYTGSFSTIFVIAPKFIDPKWVEPIESQDYTGQAITPGVVVMDGDKQLRENVDYVINYKDNIEIGVATAEVIGVNNYYG